MKEKISDLLVQVIAVMIGVSLGFLVSNWGDKRRTNTQLKNFNQNVKSEIRINRDRLSTVIEYHKMLRDSSSYYFKNQKSKPPRFFEGLKYPNLMESAFQTGVQTGILNELEMNTVQELNEIYNTQKAYSDYTNMVLSGFLMKDAYVSSPEKFYTFLSMTMTDVIINEQKLLNYYEKVLGEN